MENRKTTALILSTSGLAQQARNPFFGNNSMRKVEQFVADQNSVGSERASQGEKSIRNLKSITVGRPAVAQDFQVL